MANLKKLEALFTGEYIKKTEGSVVTDAAGALALSVSGNILQFRCIDSLVVEDGDTVAVDLVSKGPSGQYEAWIVGRLGNKFLPNTGTVKTIPASSSTIVVTGTDGVDYNATFGTNYTPVLNDVVQLLWGLSDPYVISKLGATGSPAPPPLVVKPPPVKPPPPKPTSGIASYAATDSGTYTPGYGWDRWAQQNKQVYTGGAIYGGDNRGAFFYNGSPKAMAGRSISRITFTMGARLWVGGYNQSVTVRFYTHTSGRKPGGDVTRGASFTHEFKSGQGRVTIDVPSGSVAAFAAALQAGGGIGIAGEPYAGFNGRNLDAASGSIRMYWSK